MKHSLRNIPETQIIIFIIIALLPILIVISIYFDQISFYLFNENYKYRGEFIKISVTIFGGILIGLGLRINYLRTKSIGKQTENQAKQTENQIEQIKIQGEQIIKIAEQNELTRKGQIDERFKNAIDHLGVKKSAIILGGIYTLHRIALEDESYRFTVFNILCSYIRETTSHLDDWEKLPTKNRSNQKPSIVIQTIIDLIFKSYGNINNIYSQFRADLSNSKLYYADFKGAFLNESIFKNTELHYATIFTGGLLQGSSFAGANCVYADLSDTHFEAAYIYKTNFAGANLSNSHFEGTFTEGFWSKGLKTNVRKQIWKDSEYDQIADHGKIPLNEEKKIFDFLKKEFSDEKELESFIEKIQNQSKRF